MEDKKEERVEAAGWLAGSLAAASVVEALRRLRFAAAPTLTASYSG
jgi:hypothetical protein